MADSSDPKSLPTPILDLDFNSKTNLPKCNLANTVVVLQQDPLFGPDILYHDEFLDRAVIRDEHGPREYRDDDDARITVYMQQIIQMGTMAESQVSSAVRYVSRQRSKHCVREYLHSLTWDDEPRIALAFEDLLGAMPSPDQPCEYVRAVSANFFIGMVARVMRPGCQLDTMPIFEGAQGIGKSSALRILGGDWYALAAESVNSKDFFQVIPGKWLVEIGEMDSFRPAERERTKIAISTPIDRYRASYGRRALDHPRQCVFAGTTNRDDYGNDETGLRRFLPVRCSQILLDDIAAQRDQLFAEAFAQFRAGATWWEVPLSALAVQRDRQQEDPWTQAVLAFVRHRDEVTSGEVLEDCIKISTANIEKKHQSRVGHILKLANWKKGTIRRGVVTMKGFTAPEVEYLPPPPDPED
jgi:putative DNA primase/helicase